VSWSTARGGGIVILRLSPPSEELGHQRFDSRGEAGAIVLVADFTDGIGLGGIGMEGAGDFSEADVVGDGEGQFGDQFAGMFGDDGGADDGIGAGAQVDADESVGLAVEDGAIDFGERLSESGDGDALGCGLVFGQPDVGHFWRGVGGAGDDQGTGLLAAAEQGVLNDDAGLKIGAMGEPRGRADVATGEDATMGRAEGVIDLHAMLIGSDADGFEVQVIDIRGSSNGDQQAVHGEIVFGGVGLDDEAHGVIGAGRDAHFISAADDMHTAAFQAVVDDGGGLAVLARKDAGGGLHEMDLTAETGKTLRHFTPDRPGANHRHPTGQLSQGEEGFVGEKGNGVQAGNGWSRCPRSGGDDGGVVGKLGVADPHAVPAGKPGVTEKNVHSERGKARHRIMAAHVGAQVSHALHHRGKVHPHPAGRHPELDTIAGLRRLTSRPDQCLARHTPVIQTIPTHQMPLDQGHLRPEPRRAGGRNQSGRPPSDHDQVVAPLRRGVGPIGRVDVGDERTIEAVVRKHQKRISHGNKGDTEAGDGQIKSASPTHAIVSIIRPPASTMAARNATTEGMVGMGPESMEVALGELAIMVVVCTGIRRRPWQAVALGCRPNCLSMYHVHIRTYGCQMNERDSEQVAQLFTERGGYAMTPDESNADVILINTCSVRDQAEQKAIGKMGMMGKLRRQKPHVVYGFMGCMAQSRGAELLKTVPHLDLVAGTQKYHRVVDYVDTILKRRLERQMDDERFSIVDVAEEEGSQNTIRDQEVDAGQATAFVSIMQGCNMKCTFCIVPYTRGAERARPIKEIVDEVRRLVGRGVREVTLLGQIVNRYAIKEFPTVQGKTPFVQLLEAVHAIDGLERIRFTSPHPIGYRADLIEAFRYLPKLCPHIHLPLQSGSERMLRAMHRPYSPQRFLEICDQMRAARPGLAITTDIIVGFPGETEDDYQQTKDVVRQADFDNAFIFRYSKRRGTPAAEMPEAVQVPEQVKEERNQDLLSLINAMGMAKLQALIGERVQVLCEGYSKTTTERLTGRTPQNKIVVFPGPHDRLKGELVDVDITDTHVFTLYGEVATQGG